MSKTRLLLLGAIVALLVIIPLTLYILANQPKTGSSAQKSTNISFSSTQPAQQVTKNVNVGDEVPLEVWIDPGSGPTANVVANTVIDVTYDANILDVVNQDPNNQNSCIGPSQTSPLTTITTSPTCTAGEMQIGMSASPGDPSKLITSPTSIAKIVFKAKAPGTATVSYTETTLAESVATDPNNPNQIKDAESNVISQKFPAIIIVGGAAVTPGPTAIPTGVPLPTVIPTAVPTIVPTSAPISCTGFSLDQTTGPPPLTVNMTATGQDPNGTIVNATFNFGDGSAPQTISASGSAQVIASHVYNTAGTYQASATFTDTNGASSNPAACSRTVSVRNQAAQITPLPPTGPGDVFLGIGAAGLVLTVIGAAMIFVL